MRPGSSSKPPVVDHLATTVEVTMAMEAEAAGQGQARGPGTTQALLEDRVPQEEGIQEAEEAVAQVAMQVQAMDHQAQSTSLNV